MSVENTPVDLPEFSALFCDDIREETSGKTTIVGVYGTDIVFAELPALQPKIGVFLRGVIPMSYAGQRLTVKLLKGDEVLIEEGNVITVSDPKTVEAERQGDQEARLRRMADVKLILSPVLFEAPCTLKMMVSVGDFETCARKLHVGVAGDKQPNHF